MTRTQFSRRLHHLEALVPTPALLAMWPAILREAAAVVALDDAITEALCAAVQARHQALRLPRLVAMAQATQLCDVVLAEISSHVSEPSQQYAFRKAASEACWAEARRRGYRTPEED